MVVNGTTDRRKKQLNETFEELPTTVFTVMTNLALEYGSVNLGQGFPDEEGPMSMKVGIIISVQAKICSDMFLFWIYKQG